jgi:LacI family transcriptional regulator
MKSDPITIKDIAKALNMSPSTVSRALKNSYQIGTETKKLVDKYAVKHNYKPNLIAQSLKGKKSRSVGLLSPAIPNTFFAEVISGMESVAYERDYKIIITQSFESQEREVKNLEHLTHHSIDGLLVSLSSETTNLDHFIELHDNGVPIVFFDRVTDLINTHTVTVDNADGSYKATLHLIKNGYKNIAHITSARELSITKERLMGYCKALNENRISLKEDYIKYCDHGGMLNDEIEKVISELFSRPGSPDALVTASDRITIGSFSAVHKRGLKIPDQVAIAGFCNFSSPDIFNPSLTTIKQPAFEMGKKAFQLLLQLIESKRPVREFENVVLPIELFERDSSLRKI